MTIIGIRTLDPLVTFVSWKTSRGALTFIDGEVTRTASVLSSSDVLTKLWVLNFQLTIVIQKSHFLHQVL